MGFHVELEIRISERLKTLTPEQMQKLAEEFVRIRYPERFPRFDFRAFSAEGKSRAGWPDAFIVRDGQIDGVEATIAKERDKVRNHLHEDSEKARAKRPCMAGLVLISGHPDVQFTADELAKFRQKFVEAGIPSERCELIFGMSLVRELASPEFALLRHRILNLPLSSRKFSLVDPKLPWEKRQHLFIPSVEDYKNGRVHRPMAVDDVSSLLDQIGRVLVRGIGASGKTVLARLLALDMAYRGLPSYYFDFARSDESLSAGELKLDMDDFGGQEVLFILDNIHLNELVASELACHWEYLTPSQRPKLLMLGRELRSGYGSALDGLEIPVIPLRARQPEVLGVYLRFAGRDSAPDFIPPLPPPDVLDQWVSTFGGDPSDLSTTTDLIAFSAAVLDQLPALKNSRWTLTEQHAVDAIREHYLDKLEPEETANLIRLAAMSEIEFYLVQVALVDHRAKFRTASQRLGLVFQDKVAGYIYYRLAHAALGRLLLKASYKYVDVLKEQCATALAYPFTGFAMARRMKALGQLKPAQEVLTKLMARPECLLELGNCRYLLWALRQSQALEAADFTNIASTLSHPYNIPRLIQMTLLTPLGDLKGLMTYIEQTKELQSVFAVLISALASPDYRDNFIRIALDTPINDLKGFLAYAERTKELQPVVAEMAKALAAPDNRKNLIKEALARPLGQFKDFIAYAERTKELQPVVADLANALAAPDNRKSLIKEALALPLGQLNDFLMHAERTKGLQPVFADLVDALVAPGYREKLVRKTLASNVTKIKDFLDFTHRKKALNQVFTILLDALNEPESIKLLADRFVSVPLSQLLWVLNSKATACLWQIVLGSVDTMKWHKSRLLQPAPKVETFIYFQKYAVKHGMKELLEAPALNFVQHPSRQDWHCLDSGLAYLSHVLRCANAASVEEVDIFLNVIATSAWVDEQIDGVKTGILAGALLSLATVLPEQQRRYFLRPRLEQRVRRVLEACHSGDYLAWANAISLLGAAALMGLHIQTLQLSRLEPVDLINIVESRKLQIERPGIGPLQVQLWMGLRELARLCDGLDMIPVTEAETILARWRELDASECSQALPISIRQNNNQMILWLDRCRANGWYLLEPHPTEVELQG